MIFYRVDDIGGETAPDIAVMERLEQCKVSYIASVIPSRLSVAMAKRLRQYRYATVFQHGVTHENMSALPERDEFPEGCPLAYVQIAQGRSRLQDLLGVAVEGYVPPWNRASSTALRILEQLGFKWLSGHERHRYLTSIRQINVSIDPIRCYHPLSFKAINKLLVEIGLSAPLGASVGLVLHSCMYPPLYLRQLLRLITCTAGAAYSRCDWHDHLQVHKDMA